MIKAISFHEFLKKFFPEFKITDENHQLIQKLCQWARRDPIFEEPSQSMYLEKGICISGTVGSGKTELMIKLNDYVRFIGSPLRYEMRYVWKFADLYKENGNSCFNKEVFGNRYYDELALTDEQTGIPVRELVNHFGNKILIGEELIRLRYESFIRNGYISSFTTNEPRHRLKEIYGVRAEDRLFQMCNFFILNKKVSWRRTERPVFARNINSTEAPNRETKDDTAETMIRLNEQYKNFCASGNLDSLATFDFTLLSHLGYEPVTQTELTQIMDHFFAIRREEIKVKSHDLETEKRNKQLREQYEKDKPDNAERTHVYGLARVEAIKRLYAKLKAAGKEKIFDDV